jgi:DNA repair exonuclease SbcCD ATPase subunit
MTAQPQDLLASLMSRDVQGAVRVVNLPTPSQQVEDFLNTPGITPNEAEFARNWALNEDRRRTAHQKDMIRDKKVSNAETVKLGLNEAEDLTQWSNALCERATKGEYENASELSEELKTLRSKLRELETLIEGVEQREQNIAAIEADPESYYYEFFSRFYPLASRLPTLSDALNEFRSQQ